jgi:hypothetical protein
MRPNAQTAGPEVCPIASDDDSTVLFLCYGSGASMKIAAVVLSGERERHLKSTRTWTPVGDTLNGVIETPFSES